MSATFREKLQDNLPILGAAIRNIIIFISVLSLPLSAAATLELSEEQTAGWVLGIYGLSGVLSLIFAFYYRQPILFTGNLFIIIFVTRLGSRLSFEELIGATIIAGAIVLVFGLFGISGLLQRWIPMPIVYGLLAGAVVPFVADIFTELGNAPVVIGGTFLAYIASRLLLSEKVPAIFSALFAGLVLTAITGQFNPIEGTLAITIPEFTAPRYTPESILSVSPVLVLLILLPANLPSLRYLVGQDYDPPERTINILSGIGTMIGSFLGPLGISLSLPATSLVAGSQAGPKPIRHRAVLISAFVAVLVGGLIGIVVALTSAIPDHLFVVLVGLAVVEIMIHALQRLSTSSIKLGPMFTFVVALSDTYFLQLGAFFWALVIGISVSLLLERESFLSLVRSDSADKD